MARCFHKQRFFSITFLLFFSTLSLAQVSDNPAMQAEHLALMDLAPLADATHVAVKDGSWFDPATWANGEAPGDGA